MHHHSIFYDLYVIILYKREGGDWRRKQNSESVMAPSFSDHSKVEGLDHIFYCRFRLMKQQIVLFHIGKFPFPNAFAVIPK